MNPYLLRHLWSLVDRSQSSLILDLDDNGLVRWLMDEFIVQQPIDQAETAQLDHYIRAKIPRLGPKPLNPSLSAPQAVGKAMITRP